MKTVKPILLSIICAMLLSGMYGFSKEKIEQNRKFHAERILRDMVGRDDIELEEKDSGYLVYQDDVLYARIHELHTNEGYNGHIGLYVATDADNNILSVRVYDHKETPGLGDKIDHEVTPWIDQFAGLSLANTATRDWDVIRYEGSFDSITGATITSRATIHAVRDGLRQEETP